MSREYGMMTVVHLVYARCSLTTTYIYHAEEIGVPMRVMRQPEDMHRLPNNGKITPEVGTGCCRLLPTHQGQSSMLHTKMGGRFRNQCHGPTQG